MKLSDRFEAAHKQVVLLFLLSAAIVPLFFFTREMSSRNRGMHRQIGETWFRRGQEHLRGGDVNAAIDALRKAVSNDRDNPAYRLALGRVLASGGNADEARLTLLQLRETSPESGEVNLDLGRLAAKSGSVPEAIRYYNNALYGIWPQPEIDSRRRQVRVELIEFLLDRNDKNAALSELLVFSPEIADTVPDRVAAGRWFLRAGDPKRALDQYLLALKKQGNDLAALEGAGEAAFQLSDYGRAARYLESAVSNGLLPPESGRLLALAKGVLADDPLASRLAAGERVARLRRVFAAARERFVSCPALSLSGQPLDGTDPVELDREADAFLTNLNVGRIESDPDLARRGFTLAYKLELAAAQFCASAGSADIAEEIMRLIARLHGLEND